MVGQRHTGRTSHEVMGARVTDDRSLGQGRGIELAGSGARYPRIGKVRRLRVAHLFVGQACHLLTAVDCHGHCV